MATTTKKSKKSPRAPANTQTTDYPDNHTETTNQQMALFGNISVLIVDKRARLPPEGVDIAKLGVCQASDPAIPVLLQVPRNTEQRISQEPCRPSRRRQRLRALVSGIVQTFQQ